MAITQTDIASIAEAIKSADAALTPAQILAINPNAYLCQNPQILYQVLKSCGYPVTITTGTNGQPSYTIAS
jgi:hypothetical protein